MIPAMLQPSITRTQGCDLNPELGERVMMRDPGRRLMKTGKVWGTTELLLRTPVSGSAQATYRRQRTLCSIHMHQFKHNAFVVQSGRLVIEVQKNDYALVDRTKIGPGELATVKPGEYHRFVTGSEPVEALELWEPAGPPA